MRHIFFASVIFLYSTAQAFSQGTNSCDLLLQHGISNITKYMSAEHTVAYKWHKFCGIDFNSTSDTTAAKASAQIFGYGSGSAGSNSSEQRTKLIQWCDQNRSFASNRSDLFEEAQTLSGPALGAWNQCLQMARKDIRIKMVPNGTHSKFLHFTIDSTHDGTIKYLGLKLKNYTCTESMVRTRDGSPVDVKEQPDIASANIQIDCERDEPAVKESKGIGRIAYNEAYVSVNTSGPSLSVGFPKVVSDYFVTPPSTVMAFNSNLCPSGWSEYKEANGRFIVGTNSKHTLGTNGGAETHTLTIAEMPSHNHGGATGNTTDNIVSHNKASGSPQGRFHGDVPFWFVPHAHTIPHQGGGGAHNNMPPYVALKYCVRS